ncbi:hypothetical protein AOH203_06840 [Helicobacter pylori]
MRILILTEASEALKIKDLKKNFENKHKQGMKELDRTIERRVKECEKQFRKDIQKDAEQFGDRIENFLERLNRTHTDSGFDPNFNTHSAFDFNIDTDNGINKLGLFSSIVSLIFGIFNFWNPVGWIHRIRISWDRQISVEFF